MVSLTKSDTLRYEAIKKVAANDVLAFRVAAREHAEDYSRELRKKIHPLNTRDVSAYEFFAAWTQTLAPEVEALQDVGRLKALVAAISKQLGVPQHTAEERAVRLIHERIHERTDVFIDILYGLRGRRYRAAQAILMRPTAEVADVRDRFMAYFLDMQVAHELNIAIYDVNAPFFTRGRLRRKDRRQVRQYTKQRSARLAEIQTRQEELKKDQRSMVGRILTIELDAVLAFDAHRQYKKRLDALKPASRTPAKSLTLFTAATKTIRDEYASKLKGLRKLADLQYALKEVDDVLVEIFDMTDTERNALMVRLKEYRELEREAVKIRKEQSRHESARQTADVAAAAGS